jgi:membrane associated rhomboid family serine protease
MFLPVRTDSPLRSTPYVNWALILVNVGVFVAQLSNEWIDQHWALDPSRPVLWNFITYQFLHGGPLHLLGNMLFLYIFGNNVNDKLGQIGYLAFYLSGGVFAGIAYWAGTRR